MEKVTKTQKRKAATVLRKAKKLMGPNGEHWTRGSLRSKTCDEHGHPVMQMCMTGLVLEAVGDRESDESNAIRNSEAKVALQALARVIAENRGYNKAAIDRVTTNHPVTVIVSENDRGLRRREDPVERIKEYFDGAIENLKREVDNA